MPLEIGDHFDETYHIGYMDFVNGLHFAVTPLFGKYALALVPTGMAIAVLYGVIDRVTRRAHPRRIHDIEELDLTRSEQYRSGRLGYAMILFGLYAVIQGSRDHPVSQQARVRQRWLVAGVLEALLARLSSCVSCCRFCTSLCAAVCREHVQPAAHEALRQARAHLQRAHPVVHLRQPGPAFRVKKRSAMRRTRRISWTR